MARHQVRIISIDTAVRSHLGSFGQLGFWRQLPVHGCVAGCLTGPPCETWSAARHILLEGGRGPRPLRLSELPWCLAERTGKEL